MSRMGQSMKFVSESRKARSSSLAQAKAADMKAHHQNSKSKSKKKPDSAVEGGDQSIFSMSSVVEHNQSLEFTTYAATDSSNAMSKDVSSSVYVTAQRQDI